MSSHEKIKSIMLAKAVAKERDGYVCQKCGRSREQGWAIHGAHIMPVSWSGTAADPENIIALCAKCHSMGRESAHEDPIGFSSWFNERYPGLYDRMHEKAIKYSANPFPKIDWVETIKDLKKQLDNIKKQEHN